MWRKFLAAFGELSKTSQSYGLKFPANDRKDWSEQRRDEELQQYFEKISTLEFSRQLYRQSLEFCPQDQRRKFQINNLRLWILSACCFKK
jgi:hypothetical protein